MRRRTPGGSDRERVDGPLARHRARENEGARVGHEGERQAGTTVEGQPPDRAAEASAARRSPGAPSRGQRARAPGAGSLDDEPDDANPFARQQALTVLPSDVATDRDGDGDVGGATTADALTPVVHLDFVDPIRRARADPANVLDLRVRHVASAVAAPGVVDARPQKALPDAESSACRRAGR